MDLNRHLDCTDVRFNAENGAFSKIKKWHTEWQTDGQNDYYNLLVHERWGLIATPYTQLSHYQSTKFLQAFNSKYLPLFFMQIFIICINK